jgi:hypothetical protein
MTLGNASDQKWAQRLDIGSSSTSPILHLDIKLPEHLDKVVQARHKRNSTRIHFKDQTKISFSTQ